MDEIEYYTIKSAMKDWKGLMGIYNKKSNMEIENDHEINKRIRSNIESYTSKDKVREKNAAIFYLTHDLQNYLFNIIAQKNNDVITENDSINLLNNEKLYLNKIDDKPAYIKRKFSQDVDIESYKYDYKTKKEFLHSTDNQGVVDIKKLIGGILRYQNGNIQKHYNFDWLLTGLEKAMQSVNEKQIVNILESLNYSEANEIRKGIVNEIFLHDIYESEDIQAVSALLRNYPEASIYLDNNFNKDRMVESEEFLTLFTEVRAIYEKNILNSTIEYSIPAIRNQRI